ncbi:DUF3017 domain-containing protein [Streptomyces sp. NPDC004838]
MDVRTNEGPEPDVSSGDGGEDRTTRARTRARAGGTDTDTDAGTETRTDTDTGAETRTGADTDSGTGADTGTGTDIGTDAGAAAGPSDGPGPGKGTSRRPPSMTTDTARPEGGGRAAPGDAPAPARQWPLLCVLALVGLGLVIVGADPFEDAFRVGALLIGMALVAAAVMRRTLPSVGMLAVRSRFTDMVTYGVLGVAITLLALMAQPQAWLEVPFLEDVVHFTIRG